MTRLNSLIFKAEMNYIEKEGVEVNMEEVKKKGIRTISKNDRVCTEYIE